MKAATRFLMILVACVGFLCRSAYGQVNVLMNHNDAARTGANVNETLLTTSNVNSGQFGLLFTQPVDGFIVGQPLYLQGVSIPGKGTRNVVYVATMNDSVYAFDADSDSPSTPNPLWIAQFADPDSGITAVPIADQACGTSTHFTQIGILGTPVIDASTGTLYVVAKTFENGIFVHRLHALDVTTGHEKFGGPVQMAASVTNSSGKVVSFSDYRQMDRSGLLLLNGTVYVPFDSLGCNGGGEHGWLMAYDASSLQQVGVFNTTPNIGCCGTIWEASGAAADPDGNVYVQTGDSTFDANTGGGDYGDSLIKLTLNQGGFVVDDYFTPFDQAYLKANDLDLGSSGVVILPDQAGPFPHLMVGGGKEGTVYLVNRDNLGKYCNGCPSDSQIVQSIPNFGPLNSTPAYWNNNVYIAGGNGASVFSIQSGLLNLENSTAKFGGMSSPMISAGGTSNGIMWVMNFNVLYAFDANNLANKLYFSTQAGARDAIGATAHFAMPMIANGRVYVGTTTELAVFGLFPEIQITSGNNQSGIAKTTLPVPLQVQAFDPYSGNPFVGITIAFSDGGKGGTFGNPTAITDGNGYASTTYTLPQRALPYTITAASIGMASGLFTETSLASNPVRVASVSGNQQTAPVSSPLPAPLVVLVLDAYGNAVPGVAVNFTDGGEGGSFSSSTATTNSSGKASVTYTTPANPETLTITASVIGIKIPVKFSETVKP